MGILPKSGCCTRDVLPRTAATPVPTLSSELAFGPQRQDRSLECLLRRLGAWRRSGDVVD
jgi:hypothetical protein